MHPNSGDHRGVPTFDQNLKSQLKHFLNAVAVATNLAQQATKVMEPWVARLDLRGLSTGLLFRTVE